MNNIKIEICVDTVESAIIAEETGADEIELCQALNVGGLTPSLGLYKIIKNKISIPVNVMIRPRSGDFFYTNYEKEIMIQDIEKFIDKDVDGIVVGALNSKGDIDIDFLEKISNISNISNISTTFHRAFDMCRDMERSLRDLIRLKFDRVLTSGGENTAYKGINILKELVKTSKGRIDIMAGSGLNENNIKYLIDKTKVTNVHFSGRKEVESKIEYRNEKINMGSSKTISEYHYPYADEEKIKKIIRIIKDMR